MGFIFDVMLDLIFEASKSKKIPKVIRYILIALVVLCLVFIFGVIIAFGIGTLKNSIAGGIIFIIIAIVFAILSVLEFKKSYITRKSK